MTAPTAYAGTILCQLDDIADGQGKGFILEASDAQRRIFVVRKGSSVVGYVNRCPHTDRTLDWFPDQFMSSDGQFIECASHAARFRIEDGVCVAGPCLGKGLKPVAVTIDGHGRVLVAAD